MYQIRMARGCLDATPGCLYTIPVYVLAMRRGFVQANKHVTGDTRHLIPHQLYRYAAALEAWLRS